MLGTLLSTVLLRKFKLFILSLCFSIFGGLVGIIGVMLP